MEWNPANPNSRTVHLRLPAYPVEMTEKPQQKEHPDRKHKKIFFKESGQLLHTRNH